jgi:hypothetical protein
MLHETDNIFYNNKSTAGINTQGINGSGEGGVKVQPHTFIVSALERRKSAERMGGPSTGKVTLAAQPIVHH